MQAAVRAINERRTEKWNAVLAGTHDRFYVPVGVGRSLTDTSLRLDNLATRGRRHRPCLSSPFLPVPMCVSIRLATLKQLQHRALPSARRCCRCVAEDGVELGRHPGVGGMESAAVVKWWCGQGAIHAARHATRCVAETLGVSLARGLAHSAPWTRALCRMGLKARRSEIPIVVNSGVYTVGVQDFLGVPDFVWRLKASRDFSAYCLFSRLLGRLVSRLWCMLSLVSCFRWRRVRF
jgi:hypothetical protein